MTIDEVLAELEALGDEKRRAYNLKQGAGEQQFGVKNGDLRQIAKRTGKDHDLALELWASGHLEARMLATLIVTPKKLSSDQLDAMVREASYPWLADWLNSYVVAKHPEREALREGWMDADDPMAARAGWNLTASRVAKDAEGLDLSGLLDRLEAEMGEAPEAAQWTMNTTLGHIGIHHPELRERAVAIGEALGVYRDYPVSKGCTSPFVPLWVAEMVSRQG